MIYSPKRGDSLQIKLKTGAIVNARLFDAETSWARGYMVLAATSDRQLVEAWMPTKYPLGRIALELRSSEL